jgi:hypothetical protein
MTAVGYVSTAGDARKVSKTGDTMTGELTLPDSSPDTALAAASRGYVDAQVATARVTTSQTYLTPENVVLPASGGWSIVTSSSGSGSVPLQAQIAAAVGDRVIITAAFMRTGTAQFLDWAMLASGVPDVYAASGTTTPASEGNPAYYPQAGSFPGAPGAWQFTVAAQHISGGLVTIALVTKGAGAGTVYASTTYPMSVLLTRLS